MKCKVKNLFILIGISFLVIVGFSGCPSQSQVYKLSFNTDGGSPITSQLVIENKTTSMPDSPTKEGYIFGGWYTEINGGGTEFTSNTKVTGDITVYAKWDSYSYTVTFDNQDATTLSDPISKSVISPNTTVDVLPTAPEKTGYTFGGWYTEVNGGRTEFTANTKVTDDMILYAKWLITRPKLLEIIRNGEDVTRVDTSQITDMSRMFYDIDTFNQDISSWDVSNVINMEYMCKGAAAFNQDISSWDVSNVTNMSYMFYGANLFNQDLSSWDVSNVTNHDSMFENSGIASNSYY
ncbi:MAG: BspA family leucine-rich repeat surface protein, partial [Spirochaetia bacterium]|nr:BspA family leucine-rich repeat surface protein [Spirochaetia bacterium]